MVQPISIKFYLNQLKKKGSKFPIYLRIIVDRKKAEVYTSHSVSLKDWDENKERTKRLVLINQSLSDLEYQVYEIVNQIKKDNKKLTAIAIKNILTKKDKLDYTIIEYYESCLERMKIAKEVEEVTINMYGYTKNHLANFLREEKKVDDFPIRNIEYRFLTDFDTYLLCQKVSHSERTLERNTVSKHHSRLRTILIQAMKEGYLSSNPYANFKLKSMPTQRTFLNDDELTRLLNHGLGGNESLLRVRDIFIFSVYTGLRFEDTQLLTMDRIEKDKEGRLNLLISQDKTGEPLSIPLLPQAAQIVKRYKGLPERKIHNRVLPKISNQKLNSYLKVIAELTQIKKTLTHHVARHTCATTVLLGNEVPIEVVSKWLGHTTIKTTQVYAKVTNSYLHKIAERIGNKNK